MAKKPKYFFISYRIDIPKSSPHFANEVIGTTPFEYVIYHKRLGGDYSNRVILYAEEISEELFFRYANEFEE